MTNSTFYDNQAHHGNGRPADPFNEQSDDGRGFAGAIFNEGSATTSLMQNNIVAGNIGEDNNNDCRNRNSAIINSQGYNLFGADPSATDCSAAANDLNLTSLGLSISAVLNTLLLDNGGETLTHALVAGSPAVDSVPDGVNGCLAGNSIDQRGAVRAGGSSGHGGIACDIGAYEFDSVFTPTAVTLSVLTAVAAPARLVVLIICFLTILVTGIWGYLYLHTEA